ncbi:nitroreductase [Streptomyces sp. NBC_01716]|uniref:nitroreductase n=1 Tax=Streptomyces sp. NBC_01716 TaxID=2975917 RepID=UPI002E35A8C5|nr:nitroreductase [Streptomyces sp. NBC_01716]
MTHASVSATAGETLRRALALARSARVPSRAALAPRRSFPWAGEPSSRAAPLGVPESPGGYGGPGQTSSAGERVDLDRLLRLSLAVPGGSGAGRLRPVPSAGALHPVRAHLLVGEGCSLPPGRYAYDPHTHRIHRRGPAPASASADGPRGVVAVLTVDAVDTLTHYGHRAWPLLLLDAGHAVAALVLAASETDTAVCLDADGAALAAAAGLPRAGEWTALWPGTEPEQPLAAVHFTPHGTARPDDPLSLWASLPLAAAPSPVAGPAPPGALTETRQLLELLGAGEQTRSTWQPVTRPAPVTDRVLAGRRSADPADLTQPVPEDLLARILTTAVGAWPGGPAWSAAVGAPKPALLTLTPRDTARARTPACPRPRPAVPPAPALSVLAAGEARPTLAHWAAGQRWIADAGAVLLAHGCPSDASASRIGLDHLAAGYAAGIAHVHAVAEGLPARPVGSWQQADLGAALGEAPGREWIVHALALGGPPAPNSPSYEEERP